MTTPYITASGQLFLGASGAATLGRVMYLMQGTTWDIYGPATQSTYPGHQLGICMNSMVVPGNPITVQTFGIVPPDYFLAGAGSANTLTVSGTGALGRGPTGQVIGTVDASGLCTLTNNFVASGGGLAGPILGNIGGYALSTTPLANGQFWTYSTATNSLTPTSLLITWANDLSTSTNVNQYVSSISGANGAGGTVTATANVLSFSQASTVKTTVGALTIDSIAALNLGTTAATSILIGNGSINTNFIGTFQPNADVTYQIGGTSNRLTKIYSQGGLLGGTAAASGTSAVMNITSEAANGSGAAGGLNLNGGAGAGSGSGGNVNAVPGTGNAGAGNGYFQVIKSGATNPVFAVNTANSSSGRVFLFPPAGTEITSGNFTLLVDGTNLYINTVTTNGLIYFSNAGGTPLLQVGGGALAPFAQYGSTLGYAGNEFGASFLENITILSGGLGGSVNNNAPLQYQVANITLTSSVTNTITNSQYTCPIQMYTGTLTGSGTTIFLPNVNTLYTMNFNNVTFASHVIAVAAGSSTKTVTVGATGVQQVYVDGASRTYIVAYN